MSLERPVALIAEDEPLLAEELKERLLELWPELEIVAVVHDGVAALQAIDRTRPDLVFLDIEMPRIDGLEVARQSAGRAHVAFITAYDEHALQAFDAGAVDYVLKPIQLPRLMQTVARMKARLGTAPLPLPASLDVPARSFAPHLCWINASHGTSVRLVMVNEVCYFKADSKYTLVVTAHDEMIIRKTIRDLLAELDAVRFRQVHRSTLVNLQAIDRVLRDSTGAMHLTLKARSESLAVSAQYQAIFRQM